MDDSEFANTRDYVKKLKVWLDDRGYEKFFWRDLPERFRSQKWFRKATWMGFIRKDPKYKNKKQLQLRRWLIAF